MPMDRSRYPKDWESIAKQIKHDANWTCQGCGRPCRMPGESVEELADRLFGTGWDEQLWEYYADEESGEWGYVQKTQRFTLTVAHLNHTPEDCRNENLKALCAPCHCRYDLKAMPQKRHMALERRGQLSLFTPPG